MRVIVCEGTWAKDPWGLLGDVVNNLDIPAERVEYPEQFGDAFSYNESIYIGKRALRRRISRIEGPFVIVAYSQGAHIAGDVALEHRDDPRLICVYLIADPKRSPRDKVVGLDPGGMGIFGSRPIGSKAKHFVSEHDFIGANTNPFLSNVAKYTVEKKTLGTKDWIKSFKSAASQRQPGGSLFRAIRQVKNYLSTQVHTKYDQHVIENGLTVTRWIAQDINRLAKELSYA